MPSLTPKYAIISKSISKNACKFLSDRHWQVGHDGAVARIKFCLVNFWAVFLQALDAQLDFKTVFADFVQNQNPNQIALPTVQSVGEWVKSRISAHLSVIRQKSQFLIRLGAGEGGSPKADNDWLFTVF